MPRLLQGRHHARRKEGSLAVITLAGGLVAFGCGIVHGGHFIAVCVGIVFVLFGLYSQLVSGTTRDRWINVVGIGLAFLGMGLGLSHGGFTI